MKRLPRRISSLLLILLTTIAAVVLVGLVLLMFRMLDIQNELASLRDNALPRLLKISQLSQEASATLSIAPALSARPTRFEFETLLSRIKDKEASQRVLTEELGALIRDKQAARILRQKGELLSANLRALTDVVRHQIEVRKRLAAHIEFFRKNARWPAAEPGGEAKPPDRSRQLTNLSIYKTLNFLLDPNSARFSRNRSAVEDSLQSLAQAPHPDTQLDTGEQGEDYARLPLLNYWTTKNDEIYSNKQAELSNEFKIKALAEENSLIANRLLSSANNEFWRAGTDLQAQVRQVDNIIRFTLILMLIIVVVFAASNFLMWVVLCRRVFRRLDRVRNALQGFADKRERPPMDSSKDEIGAIFGSLVHYMDVIDEREAQLAQKSNTLEQLSNQLSKYLSPQIYDSIFSGRQEVKVASERKKLTVFFPDIAGFTETADLCTVFLPRHVLYSAVDK